MATVTTALSTKRAEELGYTGGLTCAIGVTDLDQALAWYQDVLGFEIVYELRDMGWAEVQSPVERVSIGLGVREQTQTGQANATPVFSVSDIAATRAKLEEKGVRFDGDTMVIEGMVKLATFFDPDGNTYMLSESETPPA
jgi:catechol 2,3-dioxygenase-like lactoylglutathione lyase family enzyme